MATELIKAKKKCCKDRPRCKRCPLVCKRLERQGYLERLSKRIWVVKSDVPKRVRRAARVP